MIMTTTPTPMPTSNSAPTVMQATWSTDVREIDGAAADDDADDESVAGGT